MITIEIDKEQVALMKIISELAALREQVKVLREALGRIADATIEGIDGDEWFNDIANIALEQTKPKEGE